MIGGRDAMGALSALGPVGMLAGKLFGDVLTAEGNPPLATRGTKLGGTVLGDASLWLYCGSCALENDGDALARSTACGALGGIRGLGAGPCGGDLAGPVGAAARGPDTAAGAFGGVAL